MKKGDKYIFFPHLVKSMHILPPIDLKYTKLQEKTVWKLHATPFHYNKFQLGQKYKSRRGGSKNMNFKFNIHPCMIIDN